MLQPFTPPSLLATPRFQALLDQCIHCGLCLQACPTYALYGKETDSPRGRIQLMRAAAKGRIPLDGAFAEHIKLCLACRSCETACPSGVQYGALVETARIAYENSRRPGAVERAIRWAGLRQAMPHAGYLRLAARFMWLYEKSGLQRLVRGLNLLPEPFKTMEGILPPLSLRFPDYGKPAPAIGDKRGTVAFFYGCIQEAFLTEVNAATIRVLQRNGYEVHFPPSQTCCGAAQAHMGEMELTRQLARRNIDAFLPSIARGGGAGGEGYDAMVLNAGGCGAVLKEYAHLLADDPVYAEKAKKFVAQVKDLNEFLAQNMVNPPRGMVKARVTYADSCHLRHAQKVVRQPRELLKSIPGVELVELALPDRCCGSAGVYNIVQRETARAVLDAKMADIAATGADTLVVTNTGCHMQLLAGVRKAKLNLRVVHLVELLDESYRNEPEVNPTGSK